MGELGRLNITWCPILCIAATKDQRKFCPMLIILCTSLVDSQKIEHQIHPGKFIRRKTYYQRLRKAGIKLATLVDPKLGFKGVEVLHKGSLPSSGGLRLEVSNNDRYESLYGRRIRLADDMSVSATFGGLIQIDGKIYGLTVAHPFASCIGADFEMEEKEPPVRSTGTPEYDSSADSESDLDSSETSSTESEPRVLQYSISESSTESAIKDVAPLSKSKNSVEELNYRSLGRIIALRWQHRRYHLPTHCSFLKGQPIQEDFLTASDWALIEFTQESLEYFVYLNECNILLQNKDLGIVSSVAHPSRSPRTNPTRALLPELSTTQCLTNRDRLTLDTDLESIALSQGSADTATFRGSYSGTQNGYLSNYDTDIGLGGCLYKAVSVQLTSPLKNGDSGSWVWRSCDKNDKAIVGMVIAGGGAFPIAYLLPIDHIVQEIDNWRGDVTTDHSWQDPRTTNHGFVETDSTTLAMSSPRDSLSATTINDEFSLENKVKPIINPSLYWSHDLIIHEFKAKLEECTARAICGRLYVRVAKLVEWMKSHRPGESASQAACLLRAVYTQWKWPRLPNETYRISNANNRQSAALLVFAILLELGSAEHIHLFLRHGFHKNLPIDLFQLRDKIAKIIADRTEADILADRFNQVQWRYCAAIFEYNMAVDIGRDMVIPICAKERINNKGGTADLWWIQVPEEFVSKELQKVIAGSRVAPPKPDHKVGYVSCKTSAALIPYSPSQLLRESTQRYVFAVKCFEEGNSKIYENEKNAFIALRHNKGMVKYLGNYGHQELRQATSSMESNGHKKEESLVITHNILLEYGDYDLDEHFAQRLPPVFRKEIETFWKSLAEVADAVNGVHNLAAKDGIVQKYRG